MIVNNIDLIKPLLHFEPNHKSVILVWLVSRKKDGSTKVLGSNRVRTIKSYYIYSMDHLDEKLNEMKQLCSLFKCRAYICVQPKHINKVILNLHRISTDAIEGLFSADTKIHLNGFLDSAVAKSPAIAKYKYWVIDIDTQDREYINKIKEYILTCRSSSSDIILAEIPTVSGVHLITRPFDCSNFSFENAEVKKHGLTLLYYES